MEWQIMNSDGLNGTCSGLGAWVGEKYEIADECEENLNELLESLQEEDPIHRSVRRQLAVGTAIQKDLVPILTEVEDDPAVYKATVRLLVNLTQPLECLQPLSGQPDHGCTWLWDVEKMLIDAKTACTNIKFVSAIFKEIRTIMEDGQMEEYDLIESDCDTINQSLLLIRNLLHIQDSLGQGTPSATHMLLLKCLFHCGIDKILLHLLNTRQKDYWGVTVVQLISLLYKDLVSEIFLRMEDVSSCGEESCDSSNCSQCEAAMDRQYVSNTTVEEPCQNFPFAPNEGTVIFSCSGETETVIPCPSENFGNDRNVENIESDTNKNGRTWKAKSFTSAFKHSCCITKQNSSEKCESCRCSYSSENASSANVTSASMSPSESQESFKNDSETGGDMLQVTMEELGLRITDFTTQFLQKGFSSLVHVLQHILMGKSSTSPALDDSYFLWSVAFFLKFARRKEIEFKNIRDVFTTDVFGFLVFEAVANGEAVLIAHKNKQSCNLTTRRLHLSVCALRELFKTLSFHRERGLNEDDTEYLDNLQRDLANMTDLRQLFLWLIRQFKSGCHSNLFLRDVIVTNHYFLLMFEEWISKSFITGQKIDMLDHVKQFATDPVMQQYGHLLQNFIRNDHHVNNCVFTMMHHVAGDCLNPDALLQVNILKTFIEIWDREFPITREMNDLMEYVIQRFLSTAEDNPLSCAIQLFMGLAGNSANEENSLGNGANEEECGWSEEEEDKLVMWYNELEGKADIIEKLSVKFSENGMKKTKLEIVNQLYKLGWLSSQELEEFVTQSETDCKGPIQGLIKSTEEDKAASDLEILGLLSQLKEKEVIPYCTKKLTELGQEKQLSFIKRTLLEMAYVKLDGDYVEKKYVEEPVVKYYTGKSDFVPLLFYNDEEEAYRENMYFMVILEQLGFFMEEETGMLYPRMPCDWSVMDLVEKSKLLGEIKTDEVKFDVENVKKEVDITYSKVKSEKTSIPISKETKKSRVGARMPATLWMNYIAQYNTQISITRTTDMDISQ